MIVETIKEALQGLALDEWTFDGPPHNVIIWRGPEARVCFMTSDGPTRERAKFITACSPVHIAKLISDFEELQRNIQTPAPAAKEWRCFHCDEVFTDEHSAKLHFGMDQCKDPACKIKMGAEKSLLVALRNAEQELQDAWMAIHDEATEAAKAYYAQQSRHGEQLRAAEELGFERGIADSTKHIAALEEKVTALTRNEFAFTYEPTGERVSLYSSNSNAFAIIAKHPEFLSLVVAARAEIERRAAFVTTGGEHHAE